MWRYLYLLSVDKTQKIFVVKLNYLFFINIYVILKSMSANFEILLLLNTELYHKTKIVLQAL